MTKEIIDKIFTQKYQEFVVNAFLNPFSSGYSLNGKVTQVNDKIKKLRKKYKKDNIAIDEIEPSDLYDLLNMYMYSYTWLQDLKNRINMNDT